MTKKQKTEKPNKQFKVTWTLYIDASNVDEANIKALDQLDDAEMVIEEDRGEVA